MAASVPTCIAILCHAGFGGSGVVASELAEGMARRGHRVHVVSVDRPARLRHDCSGRLTFHGVMATPYPVFDTPPTDVALANKLVDLVEREGVELVHAHYAVPHAVSAFLARHALGRGAFRTVVTLHGTDVIRLGRDKSYQRITRHVVEVADAVTTPSAFLREEAYRTLGLDERGSVDLVPNFVNTAAFVPPARFEPRRLDVLFHEDLAGLPTVVHVSNFRPIKRPQDVLAAFARARERRHMRLLMVGDGPERDCVESTVRRLGLSGSSMFLGNREDFAEVLGSCDVMLLASEVESFGLAALEALSCGVPVVATRVGGLPEVVTDGVSGLLVPPGDVDALASALLTLLSDGDKRRAMSSSAREDVLARFGMERALDRWESLYRRVLARPRSIV